MSETKFTPGPWKAHPASSVVGALISYGDISKGETVAMVVAQKDKAVTEANAALIAEATALYAGLNHQIYRNHPYSETCDACLDSIKALKKARGEAS